MDFSLSEDQVMLADMATRMFAKEHDWQVRKHVISNPAFVAPSLWRQMADLGLLSIYLREEGHAEQEQNAVQNRAVSAHLICSAMGKALALEPFVTTAVMAADLLSGMVNAQEQKQVMAEVSTGRKKIAIAALEPKSAHELNNVGLTALQEVGHYLLKGQKTAVIDGPGADYLIVSARTLGQDGDPYGITLFLIDSRTAGIHVAADKGIDGTPIADVFFQDVMVSKAAIIGALHEGLLPLENAVHHGRSALLSEAVGVMDRLFEMCLEYLNTREQFKQRLAQFQSMQHHVADFYTALEQSRSMTLLAISALINPDRAQREKLLAAAECMIGRAGILAGELAVQMHGGIGMSDELAVGHYFRRLIFLDACWGNAEHHARAYAKLM